MSGQDILAASYADQAQLLRDEAAMAVLTERIAELRARCPPAPVMSTEEFFAAFPD